MFMEIVELAWQVGSIRITWSAVTLVAAYRVSTDSLPAPVVSGRCWFRDPEQNALTGRG